MAKKVIQKDLQGKVIRIWESAYQASEALKCSSGQIRKHCEGTRTSPVAGYNWEYDNSESNSSDINPNTYSFISLQEISRFGKYVTTNDEVVDILQGSEGNFFVLDKSDMTVKSLSSLGEEFLKRIG